MFPYIYDTSYIAPILYLLLTIIEHIKYLTNIWGNPSRIGPLQYWSNIITTQRKFASIKYWSNIGVVPSNMGQRNLLDQYLIESIHIGALQNRTNMGWLELHYWTNKYLTGHPPSSVKPLSHSDSWGVTRLIN